MTRRILIAALIVVASGSSMGQMMAGPMSTTQYFPLVDGARYDYMFTTGSWASATAVMHTGQTWAGASGLTAIHMTYTCNPGVTCAPDSTDFYRMDPDGMHYFGGTGADASGTQFSMMTYTNPEWLLKNPVTPGTMMGGGGYQNMETWNAGVMGTSSMMGGQTYMSSYQALALESVATPAGSFNALHVREQRGSGMSRDVWYAPGVGMVQMNDGANTAVLTGYSIPGGAASPVAFAPTPGLWWDPNQSGTGFDIVVRHGVLAVTMYSYTLAGDPQWYLAAGPLTNNGTTFSGTLDKYRGGQCLTCSFSGRPALVGNDGLINITFTSDQTATVSLPGGRTMALQRMIF